MCGVDIYWCSAFNSNICIIIELEIGKAKQAFCLQYIRGYIELHSENSI